MARPERFELPTFWFVAINTFVDLVQLTNHFGLKKGLNIVPKLDPKQGLVGRDSRQHRLDSLVVNVERGIMHSNSQRLTVDSLFREPSIETCGT